MGVNYYALGTTTWQAIKLEDYRGARGARLEGLDQIGEVFLHTDETYERVCEVLFGEYRTVYWPRHLLELFMRRFAEENPDGVEYWASDSMCMTSQRRVPLVGSMGIMVIQLNMCTFVTCGRLQIATCRSYGTLKI